jgi:hypothetical protein
VVVIQENRLRLLYARGDALLRLRSTCIHCNRCVVRVDTRASDLQHRIFVSKVGSHSLRFPRGGIEARSIVPNTRTGLVVVISTCVLGPIGAISESVVASAGPSRGCHEKSHEELEYLDKSSGAIVSENGIRDQMSVMASFWQSQNKELQTLRMRLDRGGNIERSTNKGLVLL